eukprot:7969948-Pyramimonas_sp.AAC.2
MPDWSPKSGILFFLMSSRSSNRSSESKSAAVKSASSVLGLGRVFRDVQDLPDKAQVSDGAPLPIAQ